MKINNLVKILNDFAPLETQEIWDNCGWQIEGCKEEITKLMLCLSVTEDVIKQAQEQQCDMILSHHPLFFVPFSFNKNIPIYSIHTNLDKADGGTTDTILKYLGYHAFEKSGDFLRIVNDNISLNDFILKLKICLNLFNIRVANNKNIQNVKRIAFCAGSGSEFQNLAIENGADVLVTGDIKYHTALDAKIVLIDIGHFESEILVLESLKNFLQNYVEIVIAREQTPLKNF